MRKQFFLDCLIFLCYTFSYIFSEVYMCTYINKHTKFNLFLFSILFSFISALSCTSVHLTNGTTTTFNNTGAICDITDSILLTHSTNLELKSESSICSVINSSQSVHIATNYSDHRWMYFDCTINNISNNSANCFISYYNSSGKLLGTSSVLLRNGYNLISTPHCSFSKITIKPFPGNNLFYNLSKVHFREKPPMYTASDFLSLFSILFILFSGMCLVFSFFYYRHQFSPAKNVYSNLPLVYQSSYQHLSGLFSTSNKYISVLRLFILCMLFLFLNFANLNNLFFDEQKHRVIILIICFFLVALILLFIPESRKNASVNWNNPLVVSYFIFWIMVCISDFIVPKFLPFYGYIMIFLMGFLFFIWSKSNVEGIAHILCSSIEIIYLLNIVYCFLFQPYTGYRYTGAYNNPNPYAFFLTIVGIVIECQLEYYLKKAALRIWTLLRYVCELCLLIFFLFLTQSVTATLALLIASILWLVRNFKYITSYYHHRLLHLAAAFLVCLPVVVICSHWILLHITPQIVPADTVTGQQETMLFPFTTTVNAATTNTSFQPTRIAEKLFRSTSFSNLLSDRNYFYIFYLRNMNLFGHYYRPTMYGLGNAAGSYAHNGFLSVAYTYGVYTVIPYFFMLFYYGKYALRYYRQNHSSRYAFFPLGIFVVFFIENLSDNVDTPFHWIVWFVFTFTMGLLFQTPKSSYAQNNAQNKPESH